jgi:DNA-directed RNA polymerase specialized sigma24 family protein
MEPTSPEVTQLLIAWSNGEAAALDSLMPVVYDELRRLARHHMNREAANRTLQTTALIHEAYLKLVDQKRVRWQNRAHFFAVSAQLMRRILVDMARTRHAQRRGGMARLDERKSRVVELRFFGGLNVDETAEVLKISPATVMREWKRAQAWLYCEIGKLRSVGAP